MKRVAPRIYSILKNILIDLFKMQYHFLCKYQ